MIISERESSPLSADVSVILAMSSRHLAKRAGAGRPGVSRGRCLLINPGKKDAASLKT